MALGPPFEVVFLDCDGTLCAIEGIDELARRFGVAAEVESLTEAAMEGRLPLEAVYGERLETIRPGRDAVEWLGERYVQALVEGAHEVVETLMTFGKEVHIVSSGIRQAVLRVGETLAIPAERVHAVEVAWDAAGRYIDYDRGSPLSRGGGKATVCRAALRNGAAAAMVGDGVTDLEAAAAGVYVIGFGGVVRRPAVSRHADVFVPGPTLRPLLEVLLGDAERRSIGKNDRCQGK
ncbi:MAG: HAD-IB family phosphatase [Gammaproteobacteria bacterium]